MYESDPFAAHKAVKRRQEEAANRKTTLEAGSSKLTSQPQVSKEFVNAPEVKMATSLRDTVEEAIRKVCQFTPSRTWSDTFSRRWNCMLTRRPQQRLLMNSPPKH